MIKKQKIEKLNHQGYGIIRINNKVVFVPYALKDDVVDIEIVSNYKKYALAEVVNYVSMSDEHRKVICPYYENCGGCNISHMKYPSQLEFKVNKVKDIFKRYLDMEIEPKIEYDKEFFYRNKVVFHVVDGKIGFYEEGTNRLINILGCRLLDKRINELVQLFNKLDLTNIEKIMVRTTSKEVMVVFYGYIDKFDILKDKVDSIILINIKDKLLYGKSYIKEEINGMKFIISYNSFFQVNTSVMKKLYDKVLEYAALTGSESVLDLYCGTGTIGLYLSKNARDVKGIEVVEDAIKDANINKELNGSTNIEFICGDVGKLVNNNYVADVVVVDPPRSGLSENTRKVILDNMYERIVYVSCDPMTLARDLKELSSKYEIKDVCLFDMFANTYHVESVVKLELKKA